MAVYGAALGKKIRDRSMPIDMYPPGLDDRSIKTFFFPDSVLFCKKSTAILETSDALDENVGRKMIAVSSSPDNLE